MNEHNNQRFVIPPTDLTPVLVREAKDAAVAERMTGTRIYAGTLVGTLKDKTPEEVSELLTGGPTWVELDDGVLVRPGAVVSLAPLVEEWHA